MQEENKIEIAVAGSRQAKNWKNIEMSWEDFCERLREPKRTGETAVQYFSGTKAFRDEKKDVGGFVGGHILGGKRRKGAVLYRRLLTLDADTAEQDFLERVACELEGYAWCVYSTHSHTEDKPRYRLVMPFQDDVPVEEYEAVARKIAENIGIEEFDDSTYQAERLMYWASASDDAPYVFQEGKGDFLTADEVLDQYTNWQDMTEWARSSREQERLSKTFRSSLNPTSTTMQNPKDKTGWIGAFCRTYTMTQAIDKFLTNVYTSTRQSDRYTYINGSTQGGLIIYNDLFAYSHHGTDKVFGQCLNAFDLVRLHLYGELDENSAPTTRSDRLPSFKKMIEEVSKDDAVRKEHIKDAFKDFDFGDTTDNSTEKDLPHKAISTPPQKGELKDTPTKSENKDWLLDLAVNKKGNVEATIENIIIILKNDPNLKGKFLKDTFLCSNTIVSSMPWERGESKEWSDSDSSGIRWYLETAYHISAKEKINDAVNLVFQEASTHPIREFIDSKPWDGEERVEKLFINYLGAEDNELNGALSRKMLCAAVARVFVPGIKFDQICILAGKEGLGKSSLLKNLAGDWFSDSFITVEGKEAMEQLSGAWIIELAELTSLKKAEMTSIKAFVSKQEDKFRKAYARHSEVKKRQCVFFGTTNENDFIRNEHGNRRFWVIPCGEQKKAKEPWDLTKEEAQQIWAEAKILWQKGEKLFLNKRQEFLLKMVQNDFSEEDTLKSQIELFLEEQVPEFWYELNKDERLNYLLRKRGKLPSDPFANDYISEKLIDRKYISTKEIASELLGRELFADKRLMFAVKRALNDLEGWTIQKKAVRDKAYGVVKVWVKDEDDIFS